MATGSSRKTTGTRKTTASGRASGSGRKTTSARQGKTVRAQAPVQDRRRLIEKIISNPVLSKLALPIIFIAAVLVIVGIDLIVAWNDFNRFFKILGVELLIAVVVWILKLVFAKSKSSEESDNYSEV